MLLVQLLEDSKASSEEQTKYKELNTGEDEHTDSKNWEEESRKSEEELTAKDPSDDGSRLIPRQPLVPNTCKLFISLGYFNLGVS